MATPLELKFFQASPLAYKNPWGETIAIPFLDLDAEEVLLKDTLRESNIDVSFEIATAHGVSTFLAQGKRFLHLSCHGLPRPPQLFIEDGYGGCHRLVAGENLKRWITAGAKAGGRPQQSLDFVFVSACHSRSAGDSFIDAGVPFVVCCEQDGHRLLDQAARFFAKVFYTAIGEGSTIQDSFDLAKTSIIQCPELERIAGIKLEDEAKKFVLLTKTETDNTQETKTEATANPVTRQEGSEMSASDQSPKMYLKKRSILKTSATSPSSRLSVSVIPVAPPQPFLERELDMNRILIALFKDRRKVRLVRISGEKYIGKVSLGKALAQYIKKRNMWGEILWLPPLLEKVTDTDSIKAMFDSIKASILKTYREEKALLIIDATQFSDQNMSSLGSFLKVIFEGTQYLKVIAIHDDSSYWRSSVDYSEECVQLEPLSYEATAYLFCHCCRLSVWPTTMNNLLQKKNDKYVWNILGRGNPARIRLMAKHISLAEFNMLTTGDGPIQISYFQERLNYIEEQMSKDDNHGGANNYNSHSEGGSAQVNPLDLKHVVLKDMPGKPKPAPLRTQEEIIGRFVPILSNKEKVYRKSVRSFIRKASKGEHIVTIINGVPATENTVHDNNSWCVCGTVANEYYPLEDEKFKSIYDHEHPEDLSQSNPFLHDNGYKAYRSKRRVWAHKVDKDDMDFFHHGCESTAATKEAHYMAPWGTPIRVELGDYLVMKYQGTDDIYTIVGPLFERSYTDITQGPRAQAQDLRARTTALERRMAVYRERNPDYADLEGDIRRHLQALMGALERSEETRN